MTSPQGTNNHGFDSWFPVLTNGRWADPEVMQGYRTALRFWRTRPAILRRRGPCPVQGGHWAFSAEEQNRKTREYTRGMLHALRCARASCSPPGSVE